MSKVIIPSKDICDVPHAERLIKEVWGEVNLHHHYFVGDKVHAWFIDKPDEHYQNHIAQMGAANLVIDDPATRRSEVPK